ncbi:dentin sialophosphoprotein-like isoform X2 [Perca fluviatilis]|uniref:dentin sialophosphoprotein-like isoform X2 n=1 Tax=Perca fluviatilis TaxID=8168 RepID=UPI001964FBEA|nr:dentin sialophosphoprotein-like isoform X2 [Perca fluviatilis]
MAASRENLLSLGHLTGTERNTFTKQREQSLKKSVNRPVLLQADFLIPQSHHQLEVMHLQQRWQELKERELTAQHHNRLLLQQFDEAQDTLSEMITLTAAMKTIRKEYERYLEENSPRWQQQLKEKTQAAQRKRMEEYLRSCLKNTEDHVTKSSADRPSLSQGPSTMPKDIATPPKHYSQNSHLDYNQDGSPHLPYMQSSRQTYPQSQMARFPIRAPYQPQGSSHVPPSFLPPRIFPHPHSFQLNHLASTPGHHPPSPRQNPPGWASLQPDYPWSWAAGAAGIPQGSEPLWGQLYMQEPPPEAGVAGEEADTSRAPSSKRETGGGDRISHASQELDIKPVRLSDGHAESSESSQVSREKRKKKQERGKSQCSSDRERCSSQKSSRTSSAIVIAAVTVAQSSESDDSSVKGRTSTSRGMRRSGGLTAESPRAEKVEKGSKEVDSGSHKEENQSTSEELQSLAEESRSEKVGNQSPDDKSENYREESASQREERSASVSRRIENGGGAEMEKQNSSSEQSNGIEKDEEELADDGDAEENSQTDGEKAERNVEDNDASERKNKAEEEEETEEKDEESEEEGDHEERQSDRLKNEDGENGQEGSASSQDEEVDEDESEGGEDNMEEDGESDEEEEGAGEEEEEQRRDKTGEAEKESDSEDSIISPQDKSKKMHTIAEEASEDDDDNEGRSKMGSSDDDSNEFSDEDDVEHLLAPQEQSQKKEEKDLRADEKPKVICDNVDIFQVDKSTKSDHPSDSDEFDNFYG